MHKAARNQFISEKLMKKTSLTPDGAAWLSETLDPFSDNNRSLAGYPDSDCYQTVVKSINTDHVLTKPLAAAGAWDACIFTLPFLNKSLFSAGNQAGFAAKFKQTAESYNLGMINYAAADSGEALFPDSPLTATNYVCSNITDIDPYPVSRVIGIGIEVIDRTAQLSKQGSLVAYSAPQGLQNHSAGAWENTAGTIIGHTYGPSIMGWPSSASEAIVLPSSRQWEAKQGGYMSVGFVGDNIPFVSYNCDTIKIFPDQDSRTSDCLCSGMNSATAEAAPAASLLIPDFTKPVPIGLSGFFLSGLHNDASILIRTRVIFEIAPDFNNTLVSIATPSAGLDTKALELYSYIRSNLPIAVPVSENASGDWWRRVLALVEKFAPMVAPMVAPLSLGGSAMIQTAGKMAGLAYQGAPRKVRKNKNKKKSDQ